MISPRSPERAVEDVASTAWALRTLADQLAAPLSESESVAALLRQLSRDLQRDAAVFYQTFLRR
jgi:hypothetical protein